MKKLSALALALFATLLTSQVANAAGPVSSGTLTVTGTIESSLSLTIDAADGSTTGLGTDTASSAIGNFSRFGTAPSGFHVSRGPGVYALVADNGIGITVVKANLSSTDYTLLAQLSSAPASGVSWRLNGEDVTEMGPTTLTSTGDYTGTGNYSWAILVTDAAAAAAIDNVITFTAIAN